MALGSKMSSLQEVASSRQLPCIVPETDSAWPHEYSLQDTCTGQEGAFHKEKMADRFEIVCIGTSTGSHV